jgi:hypothetical protein
MYAKTQVGKLKRTTGLDEIDFTVEYPAERSPSWKT